MSPTSYRTAPPRDNLRTVARATAPRQPNLDCTRHRHRPIDRMSRLVRSPDADHVLAPLLLAFTLASPAPVPAATRNVLLIHSYHSGYEWTDAITTGVRRTLTEQRL